MRINMDEMWIAAIYEENMVNDIDLDLMGGWVDGWMGGWARA